MKNTISTLALLAAFAAPLRAQTLTGPAFKDLLKQVDGGVMGTPVPRAKGAPVKSPAPPAKKSQYSLTVYAGFGGVDASKGDVKADDLLKGLGITVSNLTAATSLVIADTKNEYAGKAVVAPSASDPNVMTQKGANGPISFTLNFSKKVCSFSFTRPALIAGPNGITHPAWDAKAYAGADVVSIAMEGMIRHFDQAKPYPERTYTFEAPSAKEPLTSITIESDGSVAVKQADGSTKRVPFTAFNGVLLSNLTVGYCPQ